GLLALLRRDAGKSEVTGTSLGTNPIAASYRVTPTADQVSYGVGAWLMAASELLAWLRGPQGVTGLTAPLSRDYSATARRAVEADSDTTALLPVLQGKGGYEREWHGGDWWGAGWARDELLAQEARNLARGAGKG